MGLGVEHALLLDYDGTLAPFRVDRFKARPYAGVRELLTRIERQGGTRMAVVTGRPAREIGPLLGLEKMPEVWGLHGAERLHPNGRRELEKHPRQRRRNSTRCGSGCREIAWEGSSRTSRMPA